MQLFISCNGNCSIDKIKYTFIRNTVRKFPILRFMINNDIFSPVQGTFVFGHRVWADGVVVPCVCGGWSRCPSPPLRCCLSVRWDYTGSAPLPVFGVYQPPSGSLLSTHPLDKNMHTCLQKPKTYKMCLIPCAKTTVWGFLIHLVYHFSLTNFQA